MLYFLLETVVIKNTVKVDLTCFDLYVGGVMIMFLSYVSVEDSGDSQSESENSVSDSIEDNDDSVAEISRSFRSRQELCEQLNVNHMIQRIFLITLDNSESHSVFSFWNRLCWD